MVTIKQNAEEAPPLASSTSASSSLSQSTCKANKTSIDPNTIVMEAKPKTEEDLLQAAAAAATHTISDNDNKKTTTTEAATSANHNNNNSNTMDGSVEGNKSDELTTNVNVQNPKLLPAAAKKIRRAFSMPRRNPFRWSHKLKGTTTGEAQDSGLLSIGKSYTLSSCVGGNRGRSGSFVSLNSNEGPGGGGGGGGGREGVASTQLTSDSNFNKNQQESESKEQQALDDGTINSATKKLKTKSNTLNGVEMANLQNSGGINSNSNNNNTSNRVFRRSSFRKFINRIAQHMTTTVSFRKTFHRRGFYYKI